MENKEVKEESKIKKIGRILYSCCQDVYRYGFGLQSESANSNGVLNWGEDNILPEKIFYLYLKDEIFATLVNGISDYVMGNGIEVSNEVLDTINKDMAILSKDIDPFRFKNAVNSKGDDLQDIVKQCVKDYILFGTYAIDIYYSRDGSISELYYLDVTDVRLNASKNSVSFYADGIGKTNSQHSIIPLFMKTPSGNYEDGTPIVKIREVFFKFDEKCRTNYNLPYYFSALDSIEIDKDIKTFHKKGLENGLSSFKIISIPGINLSDEEQEMTDAELRAQYSGVYNAGKPLLIFDDGTGQLPTIITSPEDNYDKKYDTLYNNIFDRLFCGFRTHPILYGILTKTTGFNEQEFFEVLKLNLNMLFIPIRNEFIRDFSYIFGKEKPFEFKMSVLEEHIQQSSGDDSVGIKEAILQDLTVNERRKILGYEPLVDDDANMTVLAERLGVVSTTSLVDIIKDTELTDGKKIGTLKVLFGLSDEQINEILG